MDGKKLFFISTRPVKASDTTEKDLDIWYVERKGKVWSEPIRLDTLINSPNNEWYPTVASSGNLYYGSEREGGFGRSDIYFAVNENGAYTKRIHILDSVSTRFPEFEPFIFPDETQMIFMGIRPNGVGGNDFYYTHKDKNGKWSVPVNMKALNSPASEFSPSITADGKYFFFASSRGGIERGKALNTQQYQKLINSPKNGLGDIYFMPIEELNKVIQPIRKQCIEIPVDANMSALRKEVVFEK